MARRPLIGILVKNVKARKKYLRIYTRYANPNSMLFAFTPKDILWEKKRITGLYRKKKRWKIGRFRFPDAVYNRRYNRKPDLTYRIDSMIGRHLCFNSINQLNKWFIQQYLFQSQLSHYLPETHLYEKDILFKMLEQYNVVYCKPIYGHKGKKVYRIEANNSEFQVSLYSLSPIHIYRGKEEILQQIDQLLKNKIYLLQQGISMCLLNGKYFDIRALVQKNDEGKWTIPTILSRVAYKNYYNISMYDYSDDSANILRQVFSVNKTTAILKEIRVVSIQAANLLEKTRGSLGELCIDFGVEQDSRLWIIEINGKPQKSLYKDIDISIKRQIYGNPIDYAVYVSNAHKMNKIDS